MDGCPLTPQPRRALQLIADGYTPAQAAARMGIGTQTIRNHLHRASRTLNQTSTLQTVLAAIRQGWVTAPALTSDDRAILLHRLQATLDRAEQNLRHIAHSLEHGDDLTPAQHAYVQAFEQHLRAPVWDELGLVRTRRRMRVLLTQILSEGSGSSESLAS